MASAPPTAVQRAIAANVAGLIEDGATLQFGIGALPEAVLSELSGRRHLGVHSGLLPDPLVDLMEQGVVTGERKSLDRGLAVGGMLHGSRRLFDYADRNERIVLRDTDYTHAADVLAAQDRFVALNAAIEVDLSGQVNAEVARGRYIGAVGGAGDFLRGAARSRGGLPVVMLPARAGTASRIVARLSGPVSTVAQRRRRHRHRARGRRPARAVAAPARRAHDRHRRARPARRARPRRGCGDRGGEPGERLAGGTAKARAGYRRGPSGRGGVTW